jgi:signal transduction histidine kinase
LDVNGAATERELLRAMSDAVLAVSAELTWERAGQRMVEAAQQLAGARYAALGIPDDRGGFEEFLTTGVSDEQRAAIGPLPRVHGMLGAMLQEPRPFRTPNIQDDPRFVGWPRAHPDMHSFMGVPIVSKGATIAAFYLTDKVGASHFSEEDERLIEMLAAHAAIAIENGRLFERSRELTVVEERNRLARDLHDSVTQTLFSVVLTAEAAALLVDRDRERAKEELRRLQELARGAWQEMRALIFEMRAGELEADGLVPTLRKHIDVLQQVRRTPIELDVAGERRLSLQCERELFRIAQEALNNAIKHAQASRIDVRLDMRDGAASLGVRDDGHGFDPSDADLRSKRLGLTSMQERGEALGAQVVVESGHGSGTRVFIEVRDE